jgi:uncharacterized glyoxalase superfamily protein PhnB
MPGRVKRAASKKSKRAAGKAKRPARKAKRAASKPKGVQRVPERYHTITPHLVVKNANDAIEFYKRAFDAVELGRMPTPDGAIMHAEMQIGDSPLFLNDEMMGAKSPQSLSGSTVTIHLYVEDVDALWNQAVAAGCQVAMPLDVPPEEMGQRAAAAMAAMGGEGQPQL